MGPLPPASRILRGLNRVALFDHSLYLGCRHDRCLDPLGDVCWVLKPFGIRETYEVANSICGQHSFSWCNSFPIPFHGANLSQALALALLLLGFEAYSDLQINYEKSSA